jgi:hypothetical protein
MSHKLTQSDKDLLELLDARGVEFDYGLPSGGYARLTLPSIERLLEVDKLQFDAYLYGISPERLQQWHDHMDNPHCHALNSKGEPCKAWVEPVWDPREFDPERDVYCRYHSGVT